MSGALLLVSAGTPGVGVPSIDHCRDIHQAIALQCNDLRVCGLWQRPDHVAAGGLGQYVVEASSAGFLVAVLGDFNATLDENPLQNSGDCVMYVAMENGEPLPTRWSSSRCTDYLALLGQGQSRSFPALTGQRQGTAWLGSL